VILRWRIILCTIESREQLSSHGFVDGKEEWREARRTKRSQDPFSIIIHGNANAAFAFLRQAMHIADSCERLCAANTNTANPYANPRAFGFSNFCFSSQLLHISEM
jgi:hypothetical protein